MSTHTPIVQEARIVTEIPGPQSRALHERRAAVVPRGAHSILPVYIERAHDAILVDVDGNQFIDMCSGIGVTTVGHTHESVVDAARKQLGLLTHAAFGMTPYEPYVQVAEHLARHIPGSTPEHPYLTFFMNSGAEAVENAVKISRRFTGKPGIAVLEHAYHGRTVMTSSMNFKAAPYASGFGPRVGNIYKAPNSYPLHDGLSGAAAAQRTISYLEKVAGVGDLACLIVEPIQGEGGFIVPADGYLPALQKWCNDNGIVFVADEVQSGIARTSTVFASEQFGIEPDLLISAKGIAGGLPLSAVSGKPEIMQSPDPGGLAGTFSGNPVSCAAAAAVFHEIEHRDLLQRAAHIAQAFGGRLRELAQQHSCIAEVRGLGAMLAIELVKPGSLEPDTELTKQIIDEAAQRGVLLLSAGSYSNVIRFLPSLQLTDQLIDYVAEVISEALNAHSA